MTVLSLARGYRRFIIGRLAAIAALALALVAAFVLDVATGPSGLRLADLLTAEHDSTLAVILWDIRLPQAVTAVLVGAALALAGAEMQTTLNNALASPFTLGVTNAATLGAASAIVFDLSIPGLAAMHIVPLFAFAAALGATLLVNFLARSQGAGADTVVLFGGDLTGRADFPGGSCHFSADDSTLSLRLEADSDQSLQRIKAVVEDHLVRFGWRESLNIAWESR